MRISDWSSDVCSSDLLVHPPFWWYAWGVGLWAYGRPLAPETFALALWVIIGGYVLQRLIEGAFLQWYGMHIHVRSEEHTSELQSLMRISYAVFCLKKKK